MITPSRRHGPEGGWQRLQAEQSLTSLSCPWMRATRLHSRLSCLQCQEGVWRHCWGNASLGPLGSPNLCESSAWQWTDQASHRRYIRRTSEVRSCYGVGVRSNKILLLLLLNSVTNTFTDSSPLPWVCQTRVHTSEMNGKKKNLKSIPIFIYST